MGLKSGRAVVPVIVPAVAFLLCMACSKQDEQARAKYRPEQGNVSQIEQLASPAEASDPSSDEREEQLVAEEDAFEASSQDASRAIEIVKGLGRLGWAFSVQLTKRTLEEERQFAKNLGKNGYFYKFDGGCWLATQCLKTVFSDRPSLAMEELAGDVALVCQKHELKDCRDFTALILEAYSFAGQIDRFCEQEQRGSQGLARRLIEHLGLIESSLVEKKIRFDQMEFERPTGAKDFAVIRPVPEVIRRVRFTEGAEPTTEIIPHSDMADEGDSEQGADRDNWLSPYLDWLFGTLPQ
ncbi:MAG: hypothetical protein AB1540_11865 [Bdellovibrionota bacterium]